MTTRRLICTTIRRSQSLLASRTPIRHHHLQSIPNRARFFHSSQTLSSIQTDTNHDINNQPSILSKEAATMPVDYPVSRRLWALPPAIAIHLSIGGVYVFSMWTPGMAKAIGVIAAAPQDWTHPTLLPIFSTAALTLGLTTSTLGTYIEKIGPRAAGTIGSLFWSGALCTTALGVELHSLPLLYLGYGLLGGIAWGFLYLTPVTSVMKWFPDKRGFATGVALSAFGAGAACAPGVIYGLTEYFSVNPEFLGVGLELMTLEDGSLAVAEGSEAGKSVVVATEADISKCDGGLGRDGPGVYAVGTGDTGVAKAMGTLGLLYGGLGAIGSRFMMIPHPDWKPDGVVTMDQNATKKKNKDASSNTGLPASYVTTNTIQFPLLWMSVFGNATGGLALLSSSKIMLTDIFAGVAPHVVTPAFSTGYVSALGVGMALGRFGWSAVSDVIGRRNAYAVFGLGIPIVGMTPYLCHTVVDMTTTGTLTNGEVNIMPYLMTFYTGSILAITFYGGIFSILPAYIADLFGQKHSGAIHGKALTAWAASAVAGPMGLAYLRSNAQRNAVDNLLQTIEMHDSSTLERSFGCSISDRATIDKLIDAKTLTIEKLMEIAPPGTVDPTPFLYDTTCHVAAGLMSVAFLSNLAIRRLDLNEAMKDMQTKKIT